MTFIALGIGQLISLLFEISQRFCGKEEKIGMFPIKFWFRHSWLPNDASS